MKQKRRFLWVFFLLLVLTYLNALNQSFIASDYPYYIEHTTYINYFPYTDVNPYSKYPAVYYYIMGLLGILRLNTIFWLKFIWGLASVCNVFIIKSIAMKNYNKDEITAYTIGLLYYLFPLHWYCLKNGENDLFALMFLLLSLKLFLDKYYNFSSIFLTLGILFKVFPIFFIIPVSIFFFKNKEYKNLIKYWSTIALFFIILSLPYLIIDYKSYIEGIFIHASRMSTGNSYAPVVDNLYTPLFSFFTINISVLFIIQISVLFILFLGFYLYGNNSNFSFLKICTLVYIIAAYISFQDLQTVFVRGLPFLILLFTFNLKIRKKKIFSIFKILIIITIILYSLQLLAQSGEEPKEQLYNQIFLYIFYLSYIFYFYKISDKNQKIKEIRTKCLILVLILIVFEIARHIAFYYNFIKIPFVYNSLYLRLFLFYPIIIILIARLGKFIR